MDLVLMMDDLVVEEDTTNDSPSPEQSGESAVDPTACECPVDIDAIINEMSELNGLQNSGFEVDPDVEDSCEQLFLQEHLSQETYPGACCGGVDEEAEWNPDDGSVQGAEVGRKKTREPWQGSKVFVGNIPYNASKCAVWTTFEQFGKVVNAHIVINKRTGRSRGYGFITFREKESAARALAADSTPLLCMHGRQMRVSPALPYKKPDRGGHDSAAPQKTSGEVKLPDCSLYDHAGGEHIQRLPVELLANVMSFLPVRQLFLIQRVSQRWRSTVELCMSMIREVDLSNSFQFVGPGRLSDYILSRLLRMLPGLRRLKTAGLVRSCSHNALFTVANCCPHLVEIDLNGFSINERALKHLCSRCPKLEDVHLPDHYHFSEASVWVILRHLPALRRLDLNQSDRVSGKCFGLMPTTMEDLVLRHCSGLDSSCVARLGERGASMLRLDISGLRQLTVEDCCTMLAGMPRLRSLSMARLSLPVDQCVKNVCSTLTFLDLTSTELSDNDLKQLASMLPQLSSLKLEACQCLSESGLLHLAQFQPLSSLNLDYIRTASDNVLDSLLQLTKLKSLSLCEGFSGPAEFTADGLTRLVVGSRRLEQLDLSCVSCVTATALRRASSQLCGSRKLVVFAGGTMAVGCEGCTSQSLDDAVYDGGMCVLDYNSVPHHMRQFDDHMGDDWDDDFLDADGDDDQSEDFDDVEFLEMEYFHEYDDCEYYEHGYMWNE